MTATAPWVVYGRGSRTRWVPASTVPPVERGEPRPFALEALERAIGPLSTRAMAQVLRASVSTVQSLRSTGLTVWQADRAACRFGLHPSEVWPDWWDDYHLARR